jgi:hypothetical protein
LPTIGLTLVAHIPCCLPTLLLAIGGAASSALASRLAWVHAFDAYRPFFFGLSLITLGIAFWAAYRPVDHCACEEHNAHDHKVERRIKIGTVWGILCLVILINLAAIRFDPDSHAATAAPVTGR